jgi:tetratricopeptide (TPR) repeat protein
VRAASTIDSPPDADTPERILGEDDGRAYRRFLDWMVGDGFALAVLEVKEPRRRDEIVAWTSARVPGTRVVAMDQASGRPLYPLLEQACAPPGEASVLVLTRLEQAQDRITLFARLNIPRDELARDFPIPWVILIHPAAALEMQMHAPDFVDFAVLWLREEDSGPASSEGLERFTAAPHRQGAQSMLVIDSEAATNFLGRAQNAIELGRYDEAMDLLAQYDLRNPGARSENARRIQLDGVLLWLRGRPVEGLARLEEALRRCGPTEARFKAVMAGDIARIRAERGELAAALELHKEALKVYEEMGDRRLRAITLTEIARIHAKRGELDAALDLYKEALVVCEELGDQRGRPIILGDIANILAERGELDAALDLYKEALGVFEDLGNRRSRAIALNAIARIRVARGELDAAFDMFEEALTVFEDLGDRRSRAITLGDIAHVRAERRELDAALVLHKEALSIFEELGDRRARALTLGGIAHIQTERGELDAALDLHKEALSVFEELGDGRERAVVLDAIARIRAQRGEVDAALGLEKKP